MSACNADALICQHDDYFMDYRVSIHEPSLSFRDYKYPRACVEAIKCEAQAKVCCEPVVAKCEPAKVCCEPVVAKREPAKVCCPKSVFIPNGFVQLTETRCEVRDHDQYDCKYDFKFTEAADHKLVTKSHKNHISNIANSVCDVPTVSKVEVKPVTYSHPTFNNWYHC